VINVADQAMPSALRDPLAVEFAHAGGWYPGVVLGWRSNGDGTCSLRVRCVIGGLRRTTWMSVADLRLPEVPRPRTGLPVDDGRTRTRTRPRAATPALVPA
jgi:hypothetical protein